MRKGKKKLISIILISILLAMTLTGCGKSTSKETNNVPKVEKETQTNQETKKQENEKSEPKETVDNSTGTTPRKETLYFSGQQWGTINDWNPFSPNSNNAMAISQGDSARVLVYETLFLYNMLDGKLYPLLGKDYKWNEDQSKLIVNLNPDAKWSDGTPVTAEDVAYTFDTHVKYNSSGGADYKNYIESVKVIDDTTVEFNAVMENGKSKNPIKILEYIPKTYVLQKAYLQKVEKRCEEDPEKFKTDKMEDFVNSGPYTKFFDNEQKVVLKRNDNYWGQADSMWGKLPSPKYIAHVIYKDNAAGDTALKSGEVDVSQQFITDVQKLWEEDNLPISTYLDEAPYGICTTMPTLFFNVKREGLDRVEVRKAIAMATDFDQIISSAMSNQSPTFKQVPRSLMNPTDGEQAMINKDELKDFQFNGNDIEGAKKLLDDAGIVDTDGNGWREINGKDLHFKVECPEGWSDWNASLEIVAQAGKKIGINIETYFPDAATWTNDYSTGNFDMIMNSPPGASISNPWTRCMALLSGEYANLEVNFSGNYGGYVNEEADTILKAIPHETDQAKLKEYYTQLSKIYLEDVPSFSLMYRPQVFHTVNESVWTGYPEMGDGDNIPPTDCTDGYGIAALYNLVNVE